MNSSTQKYHQANNSGSSHSAKNEAVFVSEVVANQVVEAENANFEDGVVRTQAEVHDCQNAHELHNNTPHYRVNLHIIPYH